ncbi:MAG: oligosaccharide flippase family protein, partial [Planctomycetaceae bacterium]|nr:oligosaccharide flippase family protein [Planctomycetaceae bacterium]
MMLRPLLGRVQGSPIGKRLASGTFWSVLGNGLGKVLTLVAMIIVARMLGKETFGDFGLVRSTAATFLTFSTFAMGLASTKYIAELLHNDKERVGRIIGLNYLLTFILSLVAALVFYFCVPYLCETMLGEARLVREMRYGALLLFLMTFMSAQVGIMSGFHDFKGQAYTIFIVGLLSIPIYFVGAKFGGLHGVVMALLAVTVANIFINSVFILRNVKRHGLRYSFWDAYKELPILWQFSLPIVCSNIIFCVGVWVGQVMLRMQSG